MRVVSDGVWTKFTCYDTNQEWQIEDVKEMWDKYKVIYNPEGCFALRILDSIRGFKNPLFQIVAEDDGCIKFYNDPNNGFVFDSGWAENIIDIIHKGIDFIDNANEDEEENNA